MLFASTDTIATAILTGLGGILLGLCPYAVKWFREVRQANREDQEQDRSDRDANFQQWKEIALQREATAEKRISEQNIRLEQMNRRIDQQDVTIRTQDAEIKSLIRSEGACQQTVAELKLELALITSSFRRFQERTGESPAGSTLPTIITANSSGIIQSVMGGCAALLHWLPQELIGKNVSILVPQRLRKAHKEGIRKFAMGLTQLNPEKPVYQYAITKDDIEVPVAIFLCGWGSGKDTYINAEIRRRTAVEESVVVPMAKTDPPKD